MDSRRTRVDRFWTGSALQQCPAYFRRALGLPRPLGIALVILSRLSILVVSLAIVAFAAFGRVFGYRTR